HYTKWRWWRMVDEKLIKSFPVEYWVVVPWHFGPDKVTDEKEFKKMLSKEIDEMEEEERAYLLRGTKEKAIQEIMKIKYKTYEEAEKASGELEATYE
ncbi:MAG: hypothetical protein QXJ14_02095, partial [Candidatus Aenigmatarchaeota archaeon]